MAEKTVVARYLDTLLMSQLREIGFTSPQARRISEDVDRRLRSLLAGWGDLPFRDIVLLLGAEDALWYDPQSVPLPIRALVVMGVRNSMLEDATATRPAVSALRAARVRISDSQIPTITAAACRFFGDYYAAHGTWDVQALPPERDVFRRLAGAFPRAWAWLQRLATLTELDVDLGDVPLDFPAPPPEALPDQITLTPTVLSGYDPGIDRTLRQHLDLVRQGEREVLFSPTFKWLTRNPEKLLRVLESLLAWDAGLLTGNYCIHARYLARRARLVRPPHHEREIDSLLRNLDGLAPRHRNMILTLLAEA